MSGEEFLDLVYSHCCKDWEGEVDFCIKYPNENGYYPCDDRELKDIYLYADITWFREKHPVLRGRCCLPKCYSIKSWHNAFLMVVEDGFSWRDLEEYASLFFTSFRKDTGFDKVSYVPMD